MAVLTRMIGVVVTSNPENAKAFYGDVLGFRLLSDDSFALVFDANGTMLRVNKAQTFTPAQGTVLGWEYAFDLMAQSATPDGALGSDLDTALLEPCERLIA